MRVSAPSWCKHLTSHVAACLQSSRCALASALALTLASATKLDSAYTSTSLTPVQSSGAARGTCGGAMSHTCRGSGHWRRARSGVHVP